MRTVPREVWLRASTLQSVPCRLNSRRVLVYDFSAQLRAHRDEAHRQRRQRWQRWQRGQRGQRRLVARCLQVCCLKVAGGRGVEKGSLRQTELRKQTRAKLWKLRSGTALAFHLDHLHPFRLPLRLFHSLWKKADSFPLYFSISRLHSSKTQVDAYTLSALISKLIWHEVSQLVFWQCCSSRRVTA